MILSRAWNNLTRAIQGYGRVACFTDSKPMKHGGARKIPFSASKFRMWLIAVSFQGNSAQVTRGDRTVALVM